MAHPGPIDESDIIVCFGLCCCNVGCMPSNCVGLATETTICCLDHQCCIKPGAQCMWCECGNGKAQLGLGICSISLIHPTTCCKSQGQLCCITESLAIPPDAEVPATVAIAGLSLYPKCGCCLRLREVDGAPSAPDAQTIERA